MRELKTITGRRCYDHLGGKLGKVLLEYLIKNDYIVLEEGKSTVYEVTDSGKEFFEKIGINI